jgi:hypothetical protein
VKSAVHIKNIFKIRKCFLRLQFGNVYNMQIVLIQKNFKEKEKIVESVKSSSFFYQGQIPFKL